LWVIVGADGRARKIAVIHAIGLGLDEKAVEAVNSWRLQPATKEGQPVPVEINVEVNFRLYR
jgi:TonB family protein